MTVFPCCASFLVLLLFLLAMGVESFHRTKEAVSSDMLRILRVCRKQILSFIVCCLSFHLPLQLLGQSGQNWRQEIHTVRAGYLKDESQINRDCGVRIRTKRLAFSVRTLSLSVSVSVCLSLCVCVSLSVSLSFFLSLSLSFSFSLFWKVRSEGHDLLSS